MTTRTPSFSLAVLLALVGCAADGADLDARGGKAEDPSEAARCRTETELIADARQNLRRVSPEEWAGIEFEDEIATVTTMPDDLNGDEIADTLVHPGHGFAGPNSTMTIYLSSAETGCPTAFAGGMHGFEVTATADGKTSEGVRDVEAVSIGNCQAAFMRFSFTGGIYAIGDIRHDNDTCD